MVDFKISYNLGNNLLFYFNEFDLFCWLWRRVVVIGVWVGFGLVWFDSIRSKTKKSKLTPTKSISTSPRPFGGSKIKIKSIDEFGWILTTFGFLINCNHSFRLTQMFDSKLEMIIWRVLLKIRDGNRTNFFGYSIIWCKKTK